ncbi:MAG: hypothetical protein IKI26_01935, partial [Prevotella sp.]|nr:hypothetical protein [Prevotella sp.]
MARTNILTVLLVLFIGAILPASAQKKPVQKRDKYEFSFELPVYVEQLKTELTYPLAWGNSKVR